MDRKEFLFLLGMTTAGVALAPYLVSCKKQNNNSTLNINFTLNLDDAANSALKANGGYLVKNGVIVARTMTGSYIAVASTCTHQGATVNYDGSHNEFVCYAHGSVFSSNGGVVNGPASSPLQQLNTSLTGSSLKVYS